MKKKTLVLFGTAAVLSLALAGSIGTVVAASAANITNEGGNTGTTTVTYTVSDTWTVEIPEGITISSSEGFKGSGTVTAKDVKIEKGHHLDVTVSSKNEWKLKNGGAGDGLAYDLKIKDGSGDALTNGNSVLENVGAGETKSAELEATVKEDDQKYSTGGEAYTDELTFTVTDSTD